MAAKPNKQVEVEVNSADAAVEAANTDAAQQTIKTLLKIGKERGFVTHDELNAALPAEDFTSEQIDDVMSTLSEMGVSVVDNAESDENGEEAEEGAVLPAIYLTAMFREPMTRYECICARWVVLNCCRAKARSPLANELRPVAR